MKTIPFRILTFFSCASPIFSQSALETPLVTEARKRQEVIRTIHCFYELKEFYAAGSKSESLAPLKALLEPKQGASPTNSTKPSPETDMIFNSQSSITISGDMARFEESIAVYDVPSRTFKPSHFFYSNNQSIKKTMFRVADQQPREGTGVLDDDRVPYFKRNTLAPFTMCPRGLHAISAYKFRDFTATGMKLKIKNQDCDEYYSKMSSGNDYRLWTNPVLAHSVVRIEHYRQNRLGERAEIRYELNSKVSLWIPDSWTVISFGKQGRVLTQTDATVKELAINEREYSAEQIDIQFPEGIRVSDNRNRKEYRVTESGSLAQTDSRGNITGSTVPMPGTTFFTRNRLLLLIALSMLIAGSSYFLHRVWRRNYPRQKG